MKTLKKALDSFDEGEKRVFVFAGILILIAIPLYFYTDNSFKNVSVVNKSVEETPIILKVENKIKNDFSSFLPTYYYIKLSNGYHLSVTQEEYDSYEVGNEYDFIFVNQTETLTYLRK